MTVDGPSAGAKTGRMVLFVKAGEQPTYGDWLGLAVVKGSAWMVRPAKSLRLARVWVSAQTI